MTEETPINSNPTEGGEEEAEAMGAGSKFRSRRRYNVEDMFKIISKEKSHDLNRTPPQRYLMTPRSAKAFLKSGVDPVLVQIRDLDSFWEPRLDPSLQRIHHEAYVKQRHEFMRIVRKYYDKEVMKEKKGHLGEHGGPSTRSTTSREDRKNDSSDSNNATAAMDFMSPYDVPQTVYVTQPHGGSKKKKKRGGKKKKKGKKSLASSSLLDSLAEF
eukprot:g6383.t1